MDKEPKFADGRLLPGPRSPEYEYVETAALKARVFIEISASIREIETGDLSIAADHMQAVAGDLEELARREGSGD